MPLFIVFLILLSCVSPAAAQDPPQVVVFEAVEEPWFDTIEALGTLRANETVVLTASVTDTITRIHFDDGQRVEAGYVLAEMTDGEESALVSEMTVRLDEAERQFERLKNLPKSGAISASLYDEREREYHAARAQLEGMKSRLKDRLIIAPFSGVVGLRNISVGALVAPGDEITTLTDDSVMKLDFSVPSVYLSSLKVGLQIVAKTVAYPDMQFEGEVTGIDSRIDPATRSIAVRAQMANDKMLLKPGLLMNVLLHYRQRTAVVIPEESLIPAGTGNDVFVVNPDSNTVEKQSVTIATRRNGLVEIPSGIQVGQKVITHGTLVAHPGEVVAIRAVQKVGEGIKAILDREVAAQ